MLLLLLLIANSQMISLTRENGKEKQNKTQRQNGAGW
jgi:hypothetical protein